MKSFILAQSLVLLMSLPAIAASGILHNSKLVSTPEAGTALFEAIVADEEADVCYVGNFEAAVNSTLKKTKGAILIEVLDIYGDETEYPALDTSIYNNKKESVGIVIHSCGS